MGDSIYDCVTAVLPKLDQERLQKVVEWLVIEIGIEDTTDLNFVKEEDIKDLLTPCQSRKLIDAFQRRG